MFYHSSPRYAVESIHQFGPNVVGFQLVTGERRCYIIGYYLSPDDTSTIESVIKALKERPRRSELMLAGYLNINLEDPERDRREEEIMAALKTAGIEDMSDQSLPQRHPWCRERRMWIMVRVVREVRSQTNYILGTDRRLFRNVAVRYPWHKYIYPYLLINLR